MLSNSSHGCSVPTSTVGRTQQRQKVLPQGPWALTAHGPLQESQGGAGRWTMPHTILSCHYCSTYGVCGVAATFFLLSFLFLLMGEWKVPAWGLAGLRLQFSGLEGWRRQRCFQQACATRVDCSLGSCTSSSVSSLEKLVCIKMIFLLLGILTLTLECLNFTSLKQEHHICLPFFSFPAFICL